jgi:hypothetical protein
MTRSRLVMAVAAVAGSCWGSITQAALVSWNITSDLETSSVNATSADSAIQSPVTASRGSGLSDLPYDVGGWESRGFNGSSLSGAVANNDAINFAITPQTGQAISYSGFSFAYQAREGDRDIYTWALFARKASDSGFTQVGSEVTVMPTADAQTQSVSIPFDSLTNITETVTFRLVGIFKDNNNAAYGTSEFLAISFENVGGNQAFSFEGSVVPEPSAVGALATMIPLLRRRRRTLPV